MKTPDKVPGRRQPYEKPSVRTINLVAEEVLAVGCKLATPSNGPIGFACTQVNCNLEGS